MAMMFSIRAWLTCSALSLFVTVVLGGPIIRQPRSAAICGPNSIENASQRQFPQQTNGLVSPIHKNNLQNFSMPSLENFSNETEFGEELMNILLKMGEIEEKPDHQTSVDGKKYREKSDVKNDRYDEFIAAFNGILEEILRQGDLRKHQQSGKLNDGETDVLLGQEISSEPSERCLNQEEAELLQKIKLLNRQLSGFIKSMSKGAAKSCASENKNALNCDKYPKPRRYYRKPRGNEQFLITNPSIVVTVDESQENPQDKLSEVSGAIDIEHLTENLHSVDNSSATIAKRQTKDEHSSNTLNKENNYGVEKPTFTKIEDDDDDDDDDDENDENNEKDENDENNDQDNPSLNSNPDGKDSQTRPANSTNQRRQPSFTIANNGIQIPLRLIKGPRNGLQLVLDRQRICCRCRKHKHPY